MKPLLLGLLCLALLSARAQLSDSFDDGDFTADPEWVGDTSLFTVNSGMLQSNGPQASATIYLATATVWMDAVEWSFVVRLAFNPSSTNYVRIYLAADRSNLAGSLSGYFVQFGEAGTAPDSLDIFRQSGTTTTKIFTGSSGIMTSSSTNTVRVKIVRHSGGSWEVFADKTGGSHYNFEGSFADSAITAASHFGVLCKYSTASRYNQFYFDDFIITPLFADTVAPQVASVHILSATEIDVLFSEQVDSAAAQQITHYSVTNGIGNPIAAQRDSLNLSLVHLQFGTAFQNAVSYVLHIAAVADLAANPMLPYSFPFTFYRPQPYDILLNEIFADPDPQVALPLVEFVELYNRTAFPVSLNGWRFSDASSSVSLPDVHILPDSFLLLCAASYLDSFPTSVATVGLTALPSLNNSGDELTLRNEQGTIIHSVSYSDSWYGDNTKKNGGWSLELINPNVPCKGSANWTASTHSDGGTPGQRNSVYDTMQTAPFSLVQASALSSTELILVFSEEVDSFSAKNVGNYTVDNNVGSPSSVQLDAADKTKVHLFFASPLGGTHYTVRANVQNCAGIAILPPDNTLPFAVAAPANRYDVVINELMIDADPAVALPVSKYIELHNRSSKVIDLNGWTIGRPASTGAILSPYLLFPDSFLIVVPATAQQSFLPFGNVMGVGSFPSLNQSCDQVLLQSKGASVIHYVSYDDTWYRNEEKKQGGWSLELIDPSYPCSGKDNWQASKDPRGGSPGERNALWQSNPDTALPQLTRAILGGKDSLFLYFSKPLDSTSAVTLGNYVVNQNVGAPQQAQLLPYDDRTVLLVFATDFLSNSIYVVKVSGITDCSGNPTGINDSARFALPDTAQPGDLVINEILFNPRTAGYDFVELYNRSTKVIDLKQLDILEKDSYQPELILEQSPITAESYLLFPKEYVAVTANPADIKKNYYVPHPEALLQAPIPNYPDEGGICVIRVRNGLTLDSLSFSKQWHFVLLDDQNGVSLERIDDARPTQDAANWHSAASTVGFATPTYRNSQFSETGITDDAISIDPEVFSPDNDGYHDFTWINYRFSQAGYVANIHIYDALGREVRHLVQNELLGSQGQFQWDGLDSEGRKARIGIYIAYIELFDLSGKVKRFKKQIVLGGKL